MWRSTLPEAPAGVPRWAFLQVEDLKRVRRFIEWWIDHRQVDVRRFRRRHFGRRRSHPTVAAAGADGRDSRQGHGVAAMRWSMLPIATA